MALITCIECGKEFSDRAAACPNCGCPTEASVHQEHSTYDYQEQEEMGQENEQEEQAFGGKVFSAIQSGVNAAIVNHKDAYRPIKRIGPVQVDEERQLFRISGTVLKNGKKNGIGKSLVKGVFAVSTVGMSLLIPDGNKQKVGNKEWFPFEDLLSYELMEDDSVVTKGGVGQALIGGAIFGGFGAIAGGITGKRVQKKRVESITIKATLNSFDAPCILIPLITKPIKTNSKEYENAFRSAHEILSVLDVITHNK